MSPYAGVTNRAQPGGYFMLRKSMGKVTDWLQKSITVTVFRSPAF
ncbi:hypothetical protein [Klebsiella grimontii]|nr:hypothetical protein [Klebsiella grimontii]